MKMLRKLVWTAGLALTLVACGGGGDTDGSGDVTAAEDGGTITKEELPVVTQMSAYTEADFLSKVEADGAFQALWTALQNDGHTKLAYMGRAVQDDGSEVLWGEVAGATRGLLRHCAQDDCVHALWTVSAGKASWTAADGSELEPRGLGLPVLLKDLQGHTYDKDTEVVQLALEPPPEMPEIDVTKRRFYVLSAFGPLWANGALDTTPLRQIAQETEAFDAVEAYSYVRDDVVDDVLLHSHPYDVLVWLGQTVREEAKTNEIYKPIGMTVNHGIFGDGLYDEARLTDQLELNPLHGPGLMVLAGCETMGDGNGGGEQDKALPVVLDNQLRILVGFKKCGDARDVLRATELFLGSYLSGDQSLAEALEVANAWLSSEGSELTMVTLPEANLESTFLPDLDTYWEQYTDDGNPEFSLFNSYMNVVNMCSKPDGSTYQEDENFASAWSKETTFDGPFFSGARVNPDNMVDFEFSGTLGEIREGAHFFFVVKGSLSPRVQNLTMYGDAVIDRIVFDKEKPDEFIIEFKGQGKASPYTNEAGDTCEMQDPLLVSSTGEVSTIKVPVTWRDKPE